MRSGASPYDGTLAALPAAAAATLLLAYWLPIRFAYRSNDLGIVSVATVQRYPHQQEVFWFAFAVVVGALLVAGLARLLAGGRLRACTAVALEALGASGLLAALWLPTGAATLAFALSLAAAATLAARARARRPLEPWTDATPWPARGAGGGRALLFAAVALALATLLTPLLWVSLWDVVHRVADERLVYDNFKFHGEVGQHLAWANALRHGGLHGRDFFCLYGPLFDLGLVGTWALAGRSIAGWDLYLSLSHVVGWISLFLLGAALVCRPFLVFAFPFLIPWVRFRIGLALFGLLFLLLWMRGGRLRWSVAAGIAAGAGVLYSQEFGAALVLMAAVAFFVRGDRPAALAFAAAGLAAAAPVLGYYAARGALEPMLHDVIQYPRWMMEGYAKLPFPALASSLPLELAALGSKQSLELRLGYAVPAVCVAGALLALPISAFDPRRPLLSLGAMRRRLARDPTRLAVLLTALFGIVCFRPALARSQLLATIVVMPGAVLVLGVALDWLLDLWRRAPRSLALWRTVLLVLFVLHAGFLERPEPVERLRRTAANALTLLRRGHAPVGNRRVLRVVRWVEQNALPGEPVLFLPNNGSYYYLTDRPNPIRFVMGHQIVTEAHRAEVLSDLERNPPRFVVWDDEALRVDGLADELVFGRPLLAWIERHYEEDTRLDGVRVLRRRSGGR